MSKLIPVFIMAMVFCCAASMSFAAESQAQKKGGFTNMEPQKGGFVGPGPTLTTAKHVASMRDKTKVFLRGNIIQHLGKDKFVFQDETGKVTLEIDDEEWEGQTVSPQDTVEIYGEVDKDWNSVEIDVKRIVKK